MVLPHLSALSAARAYLAALAERASTLDVSAGCGRALLCLDAIHHGSEHSDLLYRLAETSLEGIERCGPDALEVELALAMIAEARHRHAATATAPAAAGREADAGPARASHWGGVGR